MATLIRGAGDSIGYHVAQTKVTWGGSVRGDNSVHRHCDQGPKEDRLTKIPKLNFGRFALEQVNFPDDTALACSLNVRDFKRVIYVGAQPGERKVH